MTKSLQNVSRFSRVGALLKLAKNQYIKRQINRIEYLELLNNCSSDTQFIKNNNTQITNQIKIPFNL